MTAQYAFIEALDVLHFRGNQLFGEPGSYAQSQVLPWPSVIAGAIRSAILVRDEVKLSEFADNQVKHPLLGTPASPGPFCISHWSLARRHNGRVEILMPLPNDLRVFKTDDGQPQVLTMHAQICPPAIQTSHSLPAVAILKNAKPGKPSTEYWLTESGWQDYLNGQTPKVSQLVPQSTLFKLDQRVGVGLNAQTRSTEEGRLFSNQALVLAENVGFMVGTQAAELTPHSLLRLGGDGRGAAMQRLDDYTPPSADLDTVAQQKAARLVLTSPGLFSQGWQPDASTLPEQSQLHCASVARAEILSGWDLAQHQPKPAQQCAPAMSVYWLKTPQSNVEALQRWQQRGLWPDDKHNSPFNQRRAEGFNRFALAMLPTDA